MWINYKNFINKQIKNNNVLIKIKKIIEKNEAAIL